MIPLAAAEDVIDASGVAPRIERMLASGARAASWPSARCWQA